MSFTGNPSLTNAQAIPNNGFWPNLSVGDLLRDYRIPSEYDDNVVKTGLTMAMIRVNAKLKVIQAKLVEQDYESFAAYVAENPRPIANTDELLEQYKGAVFNRAKALLLQQFATIARRPLAENAAKESDDTEQYWLDQSQACIKAFFDAILPEEPTQSAQFGFSVELI